MAPRKLFALRLPAEVVVMAQEDATREATTVSAVLRRVLMEKYRDRIEAARAKAPTSGS